jgi:hypothetical protein
MTPEQSEWLLSLGRPSSVVSLTSRQFEFRRSMPYET